MQEHTHKPLSESDQSRLLDVYMHEYEALRQEMLQRIDLQHKLAERAMTIATLTITGIAAFFVFFVKDFPSETPANRIALFLDVSISTVFLAVLSIQLLVAGWIYQSSMIFRVGKYICWIAAHKIEPLLGVKHAVMLLDRPRSLKSEPVWSLGVYGRHVKYLQVLFIYGLCGVGILGMVAMVWCKIHVCGWGKTEWAFAVCFVVILVFLAVLLKTHANVQRSMEQFNAELP